MRERAGFCRSSGIGAVRQMIYRSAGTSERRQRKSAHRLAQLAGITAGHRRGTKLRMVQLAGIAAVATAAFTSNAAAQSASIRIVSGNERFAVEAGLQAQNSSRPIVFEIDLPPTSELPFGTKPLRVTLTNAASFQNHSESAARVRNTNGSIGLRFTVSGDCINQGSKGFLGNMAAWITFSPKSNCDAHTVRATYDGLNYTKDQTGGRFYITLFQQDRPGRNSPFLADSRRKTGARFDIDAYRFSDPLTLAATQSTQELDSSGELINKTLFTFSVGHEVDTEARLSLENASLKARYDDIKYTAFVEGAFDFLTPDAQGNARRLVLKRDGITLGVLRPDSSFSTPRATTGRLILWSPETAGKQNFTVEVEGESETPYVDGELVLALLPRLSGPVRLFDPDFSFRIESASTMILDPPDGTLKAFTIPPVGEFAKEYERGRQVVFNTDSLDYIPTGFQTIERHAINVKVDIPAIDGSDGAKNIRLVFSPHADVDQDPGPGTLIFLDSFSALIKSDCSRLASGLSSTRGSFGQAFIYRIDSPCPAQRLDIRIWVDTQGSTDTPGNFHLSVEGVEDTPQGFALAVPFKVSDNYAFTRGSGYQIDTPEKIITNNTTGFGDTALATISGGDFTLDRTLLLESADLEIAPFTTAEYEDVKLLVLIESDNKRLLENFAIKFDMDSPHKLVIRSNIDGAIPAYFFWWGQRQSLYAIIGRSAEQGEVFTVSVLDTAGNTAPYMGFDQTSELKIRAYGMLYKTGEPSASTREINVIKEQYGVLERRVSRMYSVQGQPDLVNTFSLPPANGDAGLMQVSYANFESAPIRVGPLLLPLITPPAFGVARFVMPWVYEGDALAAQGAQVVTTSMQLSNLTNKTIGPVRVEVADSSVAGISADAPAMLFEMVAPYTSVEVTGEMLTDALPDFGQATLALTVDGATPQGITLRRFTDVGGDLYTDNFGTADSFNEFNPTP